MAMTTEAMRAQFEAWVTSDGFETFRNHTGRYTFNDVEQRWVVWQAALRSPVVAGMAELLIQIREDDFLSDTHRQRIDAIRPALAQYATIAKGEGKV